jgi:hypothetical protein
LGLDGDAREPLDGFIFATKKDCSSVRSLDRRRNAIDARTNSQKLKAMTLPADVSPLSNS